MRPRVDPSALPAPAAARVPPRDEAQRRNALARTLELAHQGIADATREPLCLDCHAENVAAALRGPRFQLDDGVGCEACHGASARWIASHDDTPRVTHADNVAAGLVDASDFVFGP